MITRFAIWIICVFNKRKDRILAEKLLDLVKSYDPRPETIVRDWSRMWD